MKNQREIYEALLAGETLIDTDGRIVSFNPNGMLMNIGEKAGYSFNEPHKWQIYKEPKWYENIPDGGVLCWCSDEGIVKFVDNITRFNGNYQGGSAWSKATPLTKQEIQVFMDNAPEDL